MDANNKNQIWYGIYQTILYLLHAYTENLLDLFLDLHRTVDMTWQGEKKSLISGQAVVMWSRMAANDLLRFLCAGDGLGEGYGMLGQAGSGKLRVSIGQNKLAAKVAKK